jgi:ribosome-binding factor A
MPWLDPGIPLRKARCIPQRDGRDKPGHEELKVQDAMARHKHHRDSALSTSQRQLRVGELIRHALAELLARGEVHDPVIEGHMITVPEVRMSADLRLATIYIMPLGGRDAKDVQAALERNKRYLRGEIAHRINVKFAPEIRFRIDERFDEAERIEKLLRTPEVRRDLEKREGEE